MGKALPQISASQLKKSGAYDVEPGCWVRWGFNYLAGEREPGTEATEKGTFHHSEMEDWNNEGKLPETKPGLTALRYAPPPRIATAERQIQIHTDATVWNGYIDLLFSLNETIGATQAYLPFLAGPLAIVRDWKFTSAIKYMKDATYLKVDAAAVLYARAAYEWGASHVRGSWVYVEFNDHPRHDHVLFEMPRDRVDARMLELDAMAAQIQKIYAENPNPLDLPKNTDQCFAFNKRCPFFSRCRPHAGKRISLDPKETTVDAFQKKIASDFPVKAPPPPPKKAPPPPPAKTAPVVPAAESGFINPPEAPKTPARSPEELAQQQGLAAETATPKAPPPPNKAPAAPSRLPDDLDALDDVADRDAIKAIGVREGSVAKNSHARGKSLKDLIRAHRLAGGHVAPEAVGEVLAEKGVEDHTKQTAIDVGQALHENVQRLLEADIHVAVSPEAIDELLNEAATRVYPYELCGFTLYVNCAPVSSGYLRSADIVDAVNATVIVDYAAEGFKYWQQIPYVSHAYLADTLKSLFTTGKFSAEAGVTDVVISDRGIEGAAMVDVLSQLANDVVRGF